MLLYHGRGGNQTDRANLRAARSNLVPTILLLVPRGRGDVLDSIDPWTLSGVQGALDLRIHVVRVLPRRVADPRRPQAPSTANT